MNYYKEVKEDIKFELTKIRCIYEEIEELLLLTEEKRKQKSFLELDIDSWKNLLELYTELQKIIFAMKRANI